MKKEETISLTREAKIAMLRALAAGSLNEENKSILNNFLNPDGVIQVEIIDNRLLVDGLSNAEFETAIQKIRREQFGGEASK